MKKALLIILGVIVLVLLAGYIYLKSNYNLISTEDEARIVATKAENINDPSECARIKLLVPSIGGPTEDGLINVCYAAVANVLKNPDICNNIVTNRVSKDSCFHKVAVTVGDINICKQIPDSSLEKGSCYSDFVSTNPNLECSVLGNENSRGLCYYTQAREKKDIKACNIIDSENYRDQCIKSFAMEAKDLTLCAKISGYTERADCERYVKAK